MKVPNLVSHKLIDFKMFDTGFSLFGHIMKNVSPKERPILIENLIASLEKSVDEGETTEIFSTFLGSFAIPHGEIGRRTFYDTCMEKNKGTFNLLLKVLTKMEMTYDLSHLLVPDSDRFRKLVNFSAFGDYMEATMKDNPVT
jgi:hypothetical protein